MSRIKGENVLLMILCHKPKITVPGHSEIAMQKLIDSCVVGVKGLGRRPRRLVVPINKMREININAKVHPLVLCIVIICFRISLIVHCWTVIRQLLGTWKRRIEF